VIETTLSKSSPFEAIITVTLNTAIDRVLEAPHFAIGGHLRGRNLLREPAGKGINVSRALALLGVPSIATGFVGELEMPKFDALRSKLLNTQFLAVAGETRENVTILDPAAHTETHVRTEGFTVTPRDVERLARKLHLIAKPSSLVIFAGSLPAGMTSADYAGMIDTTLGSGALVGVDAPGAVLRDVFDRSLWLIKPNEEELAAVAGEIENREKAILAAGRQLSKHIRVVIITCGADGGYAFTGGEGYLAQVDMGATPVVSTVGCGDALLAGFVAATARGESVREAFAFGTAVASAAATHAEPAFFDPAEIEPLAARTSVVTLAESG
jgi:1-phosphofructokinase family hexose kinase